MPPVKGLVIVLAAVLAYAVIHSGLRLLASTTLGEDDVADNLLVQSLQLAYHPPQPALYDWVLWAVQHVTGPGIVGFLVIKYAALIATAGFLYTAAQRILRDSLWAMLAVESMALIYQISWRYHEGFTHAVGAMTATAATLWALERVLSRARDRDFAVLGIVIGLGLLTTLTYAVYLASLTLGLLRQPVAARRLAQPGTAVTLALALLIASPWLYSLVTAAGPLQWIEHASPGYARNLAKGLLDAVRGPIFYLSPLLFILPAVFPGFLREAWTRLRASLRPTSHSEQPPDLERLLLDQALSAVALCVLGAITVGAAGYAMHTLMPLYLTSVIWLLAVARRASADAAQPRRRFAQLAAAIAVVALLARSANMFVLDPVCKLCRWGIPYQGLAQELRAKGLTPDTTIAVLETELGGNLRAQLPGHRVWSPGLPHQAPLRQPTIAVWTADKPNLDAAARQHFAASLDIPQSRLDIATATVPWRHLWRPTGYRASAWRIAIVRP